MSTLTDIVAEGHRQSEHKLCRSIEAIIAKYSHEFPDSDVVDLEAMVICEDRGELKSGNAHLFGTMHAAPTVDTRVLDCLMDAVAGSDSDESCVEEEDDGKPEPQRAKKRAKRLRPPGQVFEDVQCTETSAAETEIESVDRVREQRRRAARVASQAARRGNVSASRMSTSMSVGARAAAQAPLSSRISRDTNLVLEDSDCESAIEHAEV